METLRANNLPGSEIHPLKWKLKAVCLRDFVQYLFEMSDVKTDSIRSSRDSPIYIDGIQTA
jgi:hypothetical protein